MPAGDGVSLADPTVPLDPEAAARAIGAAIRRHHDQPMDAAEPIALGTIAEAVGRAAHPQADEIVESAPYAGRRLGDLAVMVAETVDALPPTASASVAVRPLLTLADCTLMADGTVAIDGERRRGDRELELAAAALAVGQRFGPAVVAPMFEAYGIDLIDLRRLDTCQLLVSLALALEVELESGP